MTTYFRFFWCGNNAKISRLFIFFFQSSGLKKKWDKIVFPEFVVSPCVPFFSFPNRWAAWSFSVSVCSNNPFSQAISNTYRQTLYSLFILTQTTISNIPLMVSAMVEILWSASLSISTIKTCCRQCRFLQTAISMGSFRKQKQTIEHNISW